MDKLTSLFIAIVFVSIILIPFSKFAILLSFIAIVASIFIVVRLNNREQKISYFATFLLSFSILLFFIVGTITLTSHISTIAQAPYPTDCTATRGFTCETKIKNNAITVTMEQLKGYITLSGIFVEEPNSCYIDRKYVSYDWIKSSPISFKLTCDSYNTSIRLQGKYLPFQSSAYETFVVVIS